MFVRHCCKWGLLLVSHLHAVIEVRFPVLDKSLANASPDKVGEFLNPWGRTVQQYCVIWCLDNTIQKELLDLLSPFVAFFSLPDDLGFVPPRRLPGR